MIATLPRRGMFRGAALPLLAVAVLLLAACGSSSNNAKAAQLHGAFPTTPAPKPNVTLTDTSGQPYNLMQQTQGYVTLVYFGYTHCPDVCPATMANIGTVMKQLPAKVSSRIKVVFVTTDPQRDTPAVNRAWLDHFSPSFVGLTGDQASINKALATAGLPPAQQEADGTGGYGVDHAAFVLAYTPDNLAHVVYPEGVTLADWKSDMTQLVQKGNAAVSSAPAATR